jgi:hypothetical protein
MAEQYIEKLITGLEDMPAADLKEVLSQAVDAIRTHVIRMTLPQVSLLLEKTTDKLLAINAAAIIQSAPEISENFMELLWQGIAELARHSDDMQSLLQKTRDIHVNIEASDSPFRGSFSVIGGTLSGGSSFFHFRDEDYRIMGSTKVLLQLLTGRLPMGFSDPEIQTAGHSGFAPFVGPVVKGVASLVMER